MYNDVQTINGYRMEEAKISLDALVPKNHLVHKIDKSSRV